jgi:protein-tyrosine phosphatase
MIPTERRAVANTPYRIAMICTGNICRSPMAEVSFRHLVAEDDLLARRVLVSSAGTAKWHVGSPMDGRARRALDRAGFTLEGTPGAYADSQYLDEHDLVVVMTREHLHDVHTRITNDSTDVIMLRNLIQPGLDLDVPDPYYGDDDEFDQCLGVLTAAGRRLTSEFRRRWGADSLGA